MNTRQEDSIRRARMEALADKQRSELPDVQAAALQAAIDAEDEDTAAEIARAIRNRLLKDSDAEVALDRLGLQVPSGATFTAWLSFLPMILIVIFMRAVSLRIIVRVILVDIFVWPGGRNNDIF